jgi:hypothetical protein
MKKKDFVTLVMSVVGAYKKVEDKFVDQYLTKDGESVDVFKALKRNLRCFSYTILYKNTLKIVSE